MLLVPLLFALVPRLPAPILVGELVAGIVLGRSGLQWIHVGSGLQFLIYSASPACCSSASTEIDFRMMRMPLGQGSLRTLESPLRMALAGIAIRLVLTLAIAAGLTAVGLLPGVRLAAPILAGSSLGVVLSVLNERRLQSTSYGQG